jgi:Holliday junction resolvasome RuvABC endonuclease subunit
MTAPSIIGFDPSMNSTGWAQLDYETGGLLDCGIIRPTGAINTIEKLDIIDREVRALCRRDGVDIAIEEGISYRSGAVTRMLAQVWGVVALAAWQATSVHIGEINISAVKVLATGHGKASKDQVTDAAVARWGNRAGQNDIADACWVAEAHRLWLHKQFGIVGELE